MKQHYTTLDGLRGIAALMVLAYHLFEAIAFAAGAPEQEMYHGFLAVDFFFILSGFVMGYAYDNRWKTGQPSHDASEGRTLTFWGFVRRRLIRLHPMVVMGVIVGVACFFIQGCTRWDGTHVSLSMLSLATLLALFLLPVPQSLDVRGNTEAFPLNGPHWSLFFEYLGSVLYALLLRKLPTRWLGIWVMVAGIALGANGILSDDHWVAYGWSSQPLNLMGGALRLLFAYPAGLLLARIANTKARDRVRLPLFGGFCLCGLLLAASLLMPSLSTPLGMPLANVSYQLLCIMIVFPCIVWLGAHVGNEGCGRSFVQFLGRLSYPLYAIHYPLIYLYIHWINTGVHPFGEAAWCTPVALFGIAVVIATICLLAYDEPLRRRLTKISHA